MDSQTPNDYKEYFLNKFKFLFQTFANKCYDNVQNTDIKNDLEKILFCVCGQVKNKYKIKVKLLPSEPTRTTHTTLH